MSSLSCPLRLASSKARALAGCNVFSSCCAHHTVFTPFCTTCVFSMQSTPLSSEACALAFTLSGRKANGSLPFAASRISFRTFTIASSLYVMCV